MPYLILKDPAAFIAFTETVFGATVKMKHVDENGEIRHSEIEIGGQVIMFGKSRDEWGEQTTGSFIYVENADESYRIAIGAGAESVMELSDQEYGRTCGVKDPCGNTWWITSVKQ
jgi:uncharacterized glyoxalase superfamily protein PhnB